jgi:hypothetical protein
VTFTPAPRPRTNGGARAAGTLNKGDVRGQKQRARFRRRLMKLETHPFCGVDGEGGNQPDDAALFGERHNYLLLRAGGHLLYNDNRPLGFQDCAEFLCGLPRDRTYVSYFFDYDATKILESAPWERVGRLFTGMGLVDIGDFQVGYTPHKSFRIRARGDERPALEINDLGTFFQCSFVKALEDWNIGTPEQRYGISRGKLQRGDFRGMTEKTIAYNWSEVELLEMLADEFARTCADLGYFPQRWQGPGQLASAVLAHNDVPRRRDISLCSNRKMMELANEAYYGGRFENAAHGPVHGPVYQYDINSAYPHAMRSLPCLLHGSFRSVKDRPADLGSLWFGRVAFTSQHDSVLAHLPVRTRDGGLIFPRTGQGVYWSPEVRAAERAGMRVEFQSGYVYEKGKTCSCDPFGFVSGMYAERKALGKSARGKVLKLGMNSLYGKLAQSVGSPPYANPVWASLITATTRAMIADACALAPAAIASIATDAVFSTVPLPLPTGSQLGEWDLTVHESGLFLVQPGVYFSGDSAHSNKTRGISANVFAASRQDFMRAWTSLTESGFNFPAHTVPLTVKQFISLRQAKAWGTPHKTGQWLNSDRRVSFEIRPKRMAPLRRDAAGTWWSSAPSGSVDEVSVPYKRVIGGAAALALEEERHIHMDQPDWSGWFLDE